MDKKLYALLFLTGLFVVSLLAGGDAKSASIQKDGSTLYENLDVYYFYGEGCPHCAGVELFLAEMEQKYPLGLHRFDIYNNRSAIALFDEYSDEHGLPLERRGVPAVFVSNSYFVGDAPILGGFEEAVEKAMKEGASVTVSDAEFPVTSDQTGFSAVAGPSIIAVTVAALVDSISPCSIAILVFLIGARVLGVDQRKRALKVGLSFCLSVFIAYFLFGLGLLSIVQQAGFSGTFSLLAGLVAILAGLLYFKDVFSYGRAGFVMEVPRSLKPLLTRLLKGVTSPLGAFAVGFAAACFELPCTGGPYLFILGQLANTATRLQTIPLLAYYNLIFVLPLLLISLLIYSNLFSTSKVREWSDRSKRSMKLLGGLAMVTMGFFTIPILPLLQYTQLLLQSFKPIGPPVLIIMFLYSFASRPHWRRLMKEAVCNEFSSKWKSPSLLTFFVLAILIGNVFFTYTPTVSAYNVWLSRNIIVVVPEINLWKCDSQWEPRIGSGLTSAVSCMFDYHYESFGDIVHTVTRAAAYVGDGIKPMVDVNAEYTRSEPFEPGYCCRSAGAHGEILWPFKIVNKTGGGLDPTEPIMHIFRYQMSLGGIGSYHNTGKVEILQNDGQATLLADVICEAYNLYPDGMLIRSETSCSGYSNTDGEFSASTSGFIFFEVLPAYADDIFMKVSAYASAVGGGSEENGRPEVPLSSSAQIVVDPFLYIDPASPLADEYEVMQQKYVSYEYTPHIDTPIDFDGDVYLSDVDCDDNDPAINPGVLEIASDGVDNNCNGVVDEGSSLLSGGDTYIDSTTTLEPVWFNLADTGDKGAIIVNASDIQLDCDGLTLNGTGSGTGIYNPGFDNVTIKNCNVYNYDVGVELANSSTSNTITSNTVSNNNIGITLNQSGNNKIHNNILCNHQTNAFETESIPVNKTFGGSENDYARSVVQTSDGGYAIAGYTNSFGAGWEDFWLVKTDAEGNHQWNKTFGGSNYDYAESVVQTSDGGYAIAGYTNSFGAGMSDFWLVKTDAEGNHQWNKTFGGSENDYAHSMVQTSDGGYAIAGNTWSFWSGPEFRSYFWLVKTDAGGNELWNRTFGSPSADYDDYAYSMVQTSDGGYAIAGETGYFDVVAIRDFWLVKTNASGNHMWNMTFSFSSFDRAQSVVQTSDGGYAIAGYTLSFGAGPYDAWLVKTDAEGNHQWNKTFGGSNYDYAESVVQTSDGGYAMAGYTNSFGAGGHDSWLVKTDVSGNHLWNRTFGGSTIDRAYSVVQTSDGGYVLAGETRSFSAVPGDDFWLLVVSDPNSWNTSKTLDTNIIRGSYTGGNYWSDYDGIDSDGDGLGDTQLPYNSGGNITFGGDFLPLTQTSTFSNSSLGTNVTVKASTPISIHIENVSDPNFGIGQMTEGSIGIFLNITADAPFEWAYIQISYNETEHTVDESTLRMHFWDSSLNDWTLIPDSGVNTVSDYVWANVTHFTIFTGIEDVTPPLVTIVSPTNTTYTTYYVPLKFTLNESTSWIGYSLDNNPNATITGNVTLVGLADGSHNITVYASDLSGNIGVSEMVYFTAAGPPMITMLSPYYFFYYYKSYIPLNFTVSKPTSWIGYSLDEEANVTIPGPTNLNGISDGGHTIMVYANDTTGNMGYSNPVFFFYCLGDMTGPTQWVPDRKVDIQEIFLVASKFGANQGDPRYDARADMNDDGNIDTGDLATVAGEFGKTC